MSQTSYTQVTTALPGGGTISASTLTAGSLPGMATQVASYLSLLVPSITGYGTTVMQNSILNVVITGATAAANKVMNGYYQAAVIDATHVGIPATEQLWSSGGTVNTYVRTPLFGQPADGFGAVALTAGTLITPISGYVPGEKITGSTSGATARVSGYITPNVLRVKNIKGTFTAGGEAVTGNGIKWSGTCTSAGSVLTVVTSVSGYLTPGMTISGTGVTTTTITSQATGTPGGIGTYNTTAAPTITGTVSVVATLASAVPSAGVVLGQKKLRQVSNLTPATALGNLTFATSTTATAAVVTSSNVLDLATTVTTPIITVGSVVTGAAVTTGSGAVIIGYGTGQGGTGTYIVDRLVTTTTGALGVTVTPPATSLGAIVAATAGGFNTNGLGVGSVFTVLTANTAGNKQTYTVTGVTPNGSAVTVDKLVTADAAAASTQSIQKQFVVSAVI